MIYQTKQACCRYSPWWSDHAWLILASCVAHCNVGDLARSWGQQWRQWRRLRITPQGEDGKKLDRSSWRREMDRLHAGDLQICERLEEKAGLLWMTDSLWRGIRLLGSQRPFFMPEPLNMGKTSGWLNPFSFQTFMGKRNKNLKKPCFIGIFWRSITKRIDWCLCPVLIPGWQITNQTVLVCCGVSRFLHDKPLYNLWIFILIGSLEQFIFPSGLRTSPASWQFPSLSMA